MTWIEIVAMDRNERDSMIAERFLGWRWCVCTDEEGVDYVAFFTKPAHVELLEQHGHKFRSATEAEVKAAKGPGWWIGRGIPRTADDPAADFAVLQRARDAWDEATRDAFAKYLDWLWMGRLTDEERTRVVEGCFRTPVMYRPGDYALAMLMTSGETKGAQRS